MRRCVLLVAGVVACGSRTELYAPERSGDVGADGGPTGHCVDEDIAHDKAGASALAVDGNTVFWVTNDALLRRHDARGNVTLTDERLAAESLALDAKYVYAPVQDRIVAVPRSGGSPITVASNLGSPFDLVLRDDTLYYLSFGGNLDGAVNNNGTSWIGLVTRFDAKTPPALPAGSAHGSFL